MFDQLVFYVFVVQVFGDEQVLQVVVVVDGLVGVVVDLVYQVYGVFVELGEGGVYWFVGVEEVLLGGVVGSGGDFGFVEVLVVFLQWQLGGVVVGVDGMNLQGCVYGLVLCLGKGVFRLGWEMVCQKIYCWLILQV